MMGPWHEALPKPFPAAAIPCVSAPERRCRAPPPLGEGGAGLGRAPAGKGLQWLTVQSVARAVCGRRTSRTRDAVCGTSEAMDVDQAPRAEVGRSSAGAVDPVEGAGVAEAAGAGLAGQAGHMHRANTMPCFDRPPTFVADRGGTQVDQNRRLVGIWQFQAFWGRSDRFHHFGHFEPSLVTVCNFWAAFGDFLYWICSFTREELFAKIDQLFKGGC